MNKELFYWYVSYYWDKFLDLNMIGKSMVLLGLFGLFGIVIRFVSIAYWDIFLEKKHEYERLSKGHILLSLRKNKRVQLEGKADFNVQKRNPKAYINYKIRCWVSNGFLASAVITGMPFLLKIWLFALQICIFLISLLVGLAVNIQKPELQFVKPHAVDGYIRTDGIEVNGYWRGGVDGYFRTVPDGIFENNLGE